MRLMSNEVASRQESASSAPMVGAAGLSACTGLIAPQKARANPYRFNFGFIARSERLRCH